MRIKFIKLVFFIAFIILSFTNKKVKRVEHIIVQLILSLIDDIISRIRRIWIVAVLTILGMFSLINLSGYASVINSNLRTQQFLGIVGAMIVYKHISLHTGVKKKNLLIGIMVFFLFALCSWARGYGAEGIKYMTYYLCIYMVSQMYINDDDMLYIHWIYMGICTLILAVASFGSFLKGWNHNTLSIVSVQLLFIYIITFKGETKKQRIIFMGIVLFQILMLNGLDSRGAQLAALLALLLLRRHEKIDSILCNEKMLFIYVIMPLIIAGTVVIFSKLPVYDRIDLWSIRNFSKPIFNGREDIWGDSFDRMHKDIITLFLGTGHIKRGYYHNSAVACLSAYGIFGYYLYVMVFYRILKTGIPYWNDDLVRKCIIMFLVTNVQQSTENTIFQYGSMIALPYMMLGLMLGRINEIEGKLQNRFERRRTHLQHVKKFIQMHRLHRFTVDDES